MSTVVIAMQHKRHATLKTYIYIVNAANVSQGLPIWIFFSKMNHRLLKIKAYIGELKETVESNNIQFTADLVAVAFSLPIKTCLKSKKTKQVKKLHK